MLAGPNFISLELAGLTLVGPPLIDRRRLIKHVEDRGEGLRRDLDMLTPPVVIIRHDSGITGALDEFWVGHMSMIRLGRSPKLSAPVPRAMILKTWHPNRMPSLPQNRSGPICQI
jgi:hypothetical protein